MTTEKILEQVRREPRTLIYFGDNIAQFREVAEAVYKYGDRIVAQIDEYLTGKELQLVFRTFRGKFDGWNVEDSLAYYHINLEHGICAYHYGTFINATRAKKAVIL
jgi:hypothetical protein